MSTLRTSLPERQAGPVSAPRPLLVIVGPTAVGKTETAIQVAEQLGGEIISADSRLFYRGMDIGTAKPSPAEQARVPHHLIDVAAPDERWSLAMFQQAAGDAIRAVQGRGCLPLLVGGTGQYISAVLEGWEVPEQQADPRLRQVLEKLAAEIGPYPLHARLAMMDPEAAAFIDARNVRRTVRALEVILRTGRRFSAQRRRSVSPYSLLIVGLRRPRPELYERVDERIAAMLAAGFLEEVRGLLAQGYSPELPSLSAIGYREMIQVLQGVMTMDEAVTQMKRLTRRYIRQQGAWFRASSPNIHWVDAGPDAAEAILNLARTPEAWMPPGTPLAE